jgi:hypothetical protein
MEFPTKESPMKAIIFSLALVCATAAFAQGVPLTSPKTATAAEQAKLADLVNAPGVVSVTPVNIEPAALYSTVITIVIDGEKWTFVGRKTTTDSGVELWTGDAGRGATLVLTRDGGSVSGHITLGASNYGLIRGALVKTQSVPDNGATVTPAMAAAWAKEREEQAKKVSKP